MNTDIIKNIVIVALSMLVLLFSVLIFFDEQAYMLTAQEKDNVESLLNRNGFTISSEVDMPTYFRPMYRKNLQSYEHDTNAIVKRFFGDIPFETDHEIGSTFFYNDTMRKDIEHIVSTNELVFISHYGFLPYGMQPGFARTAATAVELGYAFIHNVLGATGIEHFSTGLTARGDYALVFFARLDGHLVYSSQVRMRITEYGIVHAAYSHMIESGQSNYAYPIFSVDEALLSLLHHMRAVYEVYEDVYIIDIQLVHTHDNTRNLSTPAYLFTLVVDGRLHFNYLISAFTNMYIKSDMAMR